MTFEQIVFYIFATVSTLYVTHLGVYLVGANFYDIWQFRRRHRQAVTAKRDKDPLVSVLIPAHNEEKVVIRCLDSVCLSSYKNLQIIVVDDASKDTTARLVRDYKMRHPDHDLTLVRRRKNVGKGAALNYALRHKAQGELSMTLDADSMLDRHTIANAVGYFDDPSIVGVAANVRIIEEPTTLGILQKFEHMIGYRSKKTYSLTKSEFVIGGVASTYRMDVLREVDYYDTDTYTEDIGLSIKIVSSKGNRHNRIIYAADVTAMTEGVESFKGLLRQRFRWKYGSLQNVVKYRHLLFNLDRQFTRRLTFYRMPMAFLSELVLLFTPITWGYVLFISFSEQTLQLIVGAYLTVTAYTFITLWFDEHTKGWNRVRLSAYAPIMYFIFYIMDVIQFVAILRCLFRIRRLTGGKDAVSTWVSPQRIGRQIVTGET
jgi:cellulose synthase/poly-beta-1,6-N-acetylglucosamine synthase-like glycosyltransferase